MIFAEAAADMKAREARMSDAQRERMRTLTAYRGQWNPIHANELTWAEGCPKMAAELVALHHIMYPELI